MRRDPKRFLVWRWRLLEVDARVPIRLTAVWRDWFGVIPSFNEGAVSGISFNVEEGRGFIFGRPNRVQVSGSLVAQVRTLLEGKHGCEARFANAGEIPKPPKLRAPGLCDDAAVEQWPPPRELHQAVVAEVAPGAGWYAASNAAGPYPVVADPHGACTFESVEEALAWLDQQPEHMQFTLRYLGAAVAEADQREAAALEAHH